MSSYIAESYLSRTRRGELASQATRARDSAHALAREGHEVAYLRSAFVPEDEVCLHWFIAPSPAFVTEIGRLAKLEFDRVIKEVEQPPYESDGTDPASRISHPVQATAISHTTTTEEAQIEHHHS